MEAWPAQSPESQNLAHVTSEARALVSWLQRMPGLAQPSAARCEGMGYRRVTS